jgi:hypothetical protein
VKDSAMICANFEVNNQLKGRMIDEKEVKNYNLKILE